MALEKDCQSKSLQHFQLKKIGYHNVRVLFIIIAISLGMLIVGSNYGENKTDFQLFEGDLVIRNYGSSLICSEYDAKENSIKASTFKIINIDTIQMAKFENIIIEDLKVKNKADME